MDKVLATTKTPITVYVSIRRTAYISADKSTVTGLTKQLIILGKMFVAFLFEVFDLPNDGTVFELLGKSVCDCLTRVGFQFLTRHAASIHVQIVDDNLI